MDTMRAVLESNSLPDTLKSKTPSGGYHIFLKGEAVPNGVDVLGPGVDVRSDHGYVVAPGSKTDVGPYRWVNGTRAIADAPAWVRDKCLTKKVTKAEVREMPEGVSRDLALERAQTFLAARDPAIEGQGGDAWTYETLCFLRDMGVRLEDIPEVVLEWNELCLPPWNPDELYKKAENAFKYGQNDAGKRAFEADFDDLSDEPIPEPELPVDRWLYTPTDVEPDHVLKNDYLVKGWLDRERQALLFGKWGAGKTFNALNLSAHIALGLEWFGQRVRQGGVLFMAYEGEAAMKKRILALVTEKFPGFDMPLYIRHMNAPLILKRTPGNTMKAKGAAILETCMEQIKRKDGEYPALVVVDPLRNALGGSDSDVEYTQPYLEYTKRLTERYGCATLTVHHPGHGEGQRSRGDSGIEASMDSVIRLDGALGSLSSTKQRDSIKGTLYYALRIVELGKDDDGDPVTTCVVDHISDSETDPRLTTAQEEFIDALKELANEEGLIKKSDVSKTGDMNNDTRRDMVRILLKKKYLMVDSQGYWLGGGPTLEMFS